MHGMTGPAQTSMHLHRGIEESFLGVRASSQGQNLESLSPLVVDGST